MPFHAPPSLPHVPPHLLFLLLQPPPNPAYGGYAPNAPSGGGGGMSEIDLNDQTPTPLHKSSSWINPASGVADLRSNSHGPASDPGARGAINTVRFEACQQKALLVRAGFLRRWRILHMLQKYDEYTTDWH